MDHLGDILSLCFNLLGLMIVFNNTPLVTAFSFTERDTYLANHGTKTVYSQDWLSCTIACQDDNMCISYNYNMLTGSCDLNEHGIQQPFSGPDELVKMQGVIFHQIRVRKSLIFSGDDFPVQFNTDSETDSNHNLIIYTSIVLITKT